MQRSRFETVVSAPTGEIIAVDRRRLTEIPYFLLTNPTQNIVPVPANGSVDPVSMSVSSEGPAEVLAWTYQSTGNFTTVMRVRDGVERRTLMNSPIHCRCLFGTNLMPYRLPESLLVDEQRVIDIALYDVSGAINNIRVAAQAVRYLEILDDPKSERLKLRMRRREHLSFPFWYGLEGPGYAELAAGATGTFPITILDDHFELHTLSYFGTTSQDIDIQIVDVTKGEPLIDAFGGQSYMINAQLFLFTGDYAFRFHEPRLFMANSKLVVQLRNNGALTNRIYMSLGGRALASRIIKER